MDAEAFRQQLEETKRTELDRLGSNRLLIALTDADLETGTVLRVAADSEHAAHNTFTEWAGDEPDRGAAAAFEWAADREADHRRRVLATLNEEYDPVDGGPLHTYLRGRQTTVDRVAAGLVARPLVSDRTHKQIVSFFVNEADRARAELFRDLRMETGEELEHGLDLLDDVCDSEDDWERARMVAEYTVDLVYDDYADTLRGMGLDVKSVC